MVKTLINSCILILLFALFACTGSTGSKVLTVNQHADEYQLVWQDEFDYTGLPDSSKWGYDT